MLRNVFISTVFLSVFISAQSQTQYKGILFGSVLDDSTGAILENANVFISQTTLGTTTNQRGKFEIKNIPEGVYDIISSRVGYNVYKVRATITSAPLSITIRLKPNIVSLEEVTVSAEKPELWHKQFEQFKKFFFGNSPNANECKIINPEILDFTEEEEYFSATAREPLIIENGALGYRIVYLMRVFHAKPVTARLGNTIGKGYSIVFDGFPKFSQLQPSAPERKSLWIKNRRATYEGSLSHFLSALYRGTWQKEGFLINLMPEVDLHNTPINRTIINNSTLDSILFPAKSAEDKILRFDGVLEVEYIFKQLDTKIDILKKQGTEHPVSWLQLNYSSITFNSLGVVQETTPTNVYGFWSSLRFADMMPLDYVSEN